MSSRLTVEWAPYADKYLGVSNLPSRVSLSKEVGSGGEAVVRSVRELPNALVKLYHTNDPRELQFRERKIKAMIKAKPQEPTPDHVTFAWPLGMVYDGRRRFRGFVMPYIKCAIPISSIMVPNDYSWVDKFRECGVPDDRLNRIMSNISLFKVGVALNLVKAVGYLHAVGHYVGDLNDMNILINSYGLVTLIDTDSFFIRDPDTGQIYPSEVGVGDYTAPEVLRGLIPPDKRNENTDIFSLSVIIFKLLMNGYHPFAGTVPSRESNTIEDNIRSCLSPYFGPGKNIVIKPRGAPDISSLPPELVNLFERTFNCSNLNRPSIVEFLKALEKYYYIVKSNPPPPTPPTPPAPRQKPSKREPQRRKPRRKRTQPSPFPPPPQPPLPPPPPLPPLQQRRSLPKYYMISIPLLLVALSLLYLKVLSYSGVMGPWSKVFSFFSSIIAFIIAAKFVNSNEDILWIMPTIGETILIFINI